MWVMVLQGYATTATFYCPSDSIGQGPSDLYWLASNPPGTWAGRYVANFGGRPNESINAPTNFHGWGESYSIAFPHPGYGQGYIHYLSGTIDVGRWWTTNGANTEVPLVSDMAPLDGGGIDASAGDGPGHGIYQRITTTLPTANTYGPYIYNSGNHQGAGQNVGFGDDHVTWEISPYVGQNGDNIFTFHYYASGTATPVNGTTDTNQIGLTACGGWNDQDPNQMPLAPGILTLAPPFDTCMTPVRVVNPFVSATASSPAW
jgi:hypothetical protein